MQTLALVRSMEDWLPWAQRGAAPIELPPATAIDGLVTGMFAPRVSRCLYLSGDPLGKYSSEDRGDLKTGGTLSPTHTEKTTPFCPSYPLRFAHPVSPRLLRPALGLRPTEAQTSVTGQPRPRSGRSERGNLTDAGWDVPEAQSISTHRGVAGSGTTTHDKVRHQVL